MHNQNFTPFPVLVTERLILRQLSLEDENQIFLLRSDAEVNKFLDRPAATSLEDARQFIIKINDSISRNESLYWGINLKNDPCLIGTICLWNLSIEENKAELGYEMLPSFQGQGLMQEAVFKVLQFGFETMQLRTIEGWPRADNSSSIKLLEKNNFERDMGAESKMPAEEKLAGMLIYALTKNKMT